MAPVLWSNKYHHYAIQDNYVFTDLPSAARRNHGYIVIVLFLLPVCPGHAFRKLSPETGTGEYVDYKYRWQESGEGSKGHSYPGIRSAHIRATEQHRQFQQRHH